MLKDASLFQTKQFNVVDLCSDNCFCESAEYAMTTDVSTPLIIAKLCDGKYKSIDGNHRLYKAMKLGVEIILAYFLKKDEHIAYIENYDEKLYDKIVSEF